MPGTRPLSATERLYIAVDQLNPPFVNQFVLEGPAATFTYSNWVSAVFTASRVNVGSRLELKGGLGWSRFQDSGRLPPVRLINAANWSGRDPEHASFLQKPLPLTGGCSCEVILLSGNPARVIFRSHHAVMDGGGTLHWAAEVFRALNGQPLQGSSLGLTDIELARSLNAGMQAKREQDSPAPTGAYDTAASGVTWRRLTLRGKQPSLLARVALFVGQQARRSADDVIHIAIPVDLRRHVSTGANMANLTGFIHIDVSANATVADLTGQIQAKLQQREYATLSPGLRIAPFMPIKLLKAGIQQAMNGVSRGALFADSAVLSNLGKLDLSVFTSVDFTPETGFFIPPGNGVSPLFMALSGTDNGIELVASMPAGFASNGRIDQFMNGLEAFLQGEDA